MTLFTTMPEIKLNDPMNDISSTNTTCLRSYIQAYLPGEFIGFSLKAAHLFQAGDINISSSKEYSVLVIWKILLKNPQRFMRLESFSTALRDVPKYIFFGKISHSKVVYDRSEAGFI